MQPDIRLIDQMRAQLHHLLVTNPELEEDEVLRVDMIEAETDALSLLDELIQAERMAQALAQGIDGEIDRLKKRQDRFEARRIALRKYMMQLMEAANLKKAERPAATVSIAAGRPKVVITDPDAIPDYCIRIKREINKETIANFLKDGETIPGATLSNAEPTLRIS